MRGKLTSLEPAVDAVFHLENTGRTLSDVDKTYEVREAEKAAAEAELAAEKARKARELELLEQIAASLKESK